MRAETSCFCTLLIVSSILLFAQGTETLGDLSHVQILDDVDVEADLGAQLGTVSTSVAEPAGDEAGQQLVANAETGFADAPSPRSAELERFKKMAAEAKARLEAAKAPLSDDEVARLLNNATAWAKTRFMTIQEKRKQEASGHEAMMKKVKKTDIELNKAQATAQAAQQKAVEEQLVAAGQSLQEAQDIAVRPGMLTAGGTFVVHRPSSMGPSVVPPARRQLLSNTGLPDDKYKVSFSPNGQILLKDLHHGANVANARVRCAGQGTGHRGCRQQAQVSASEESSIGA